MNVGVMKDTDEMFASVMGECDLDVMVAPSKLSVIRVKPEMSSYGKYTTHRSSKLETG
jgi:hypothetical protein